MFNKRGVSEIVGYVLLISISFALAAMVFSWLKFYVTPGEEFECDEGVSISIRGYSCNETFLNISLRNDGRFNIDGYIVRVNNKTSNAKLGVYTLNETGKPLKVGEQVYYDYYSPLQDLSDKPIGGKLTLVEVQPYVIQKSSRVYCSDVSKHVLECN